MRSSSGCCPGLGKPLGFQPVFACVGKSKCDFLVLSGDKWREKIFLLSDKSA